MWSCIDDIVKLDLIKLNSCKGKYQPWTSFDLNVSEKAELSALICHIGQNFKIPSVIFTVFDESYENILIKISNKIC